MQTPVSTVAQPARRYTLPDDPHLIVYERGDVRWPRRPRGSNGTGAGAFCKSAHAPAATRKNANVMTPVSSSYVMLRRPLSSMLPALYPAVVRVQQVLRAYARYICIV